MVKSKAWQWEIVEKNSYWNTPDPIVYYLKKRWSDLEFKTFLDIGCGLGRHCVFMAKADFEVSGFDLSEHGINLTSEKLKENNLKAKLVVADMLNFPYEDNTFDCMLAMNVIAHTDTIGFKQILNEILRCLKPGGEVYLSLGSKESFWFKNPACVYVDENTIIKVEDGPENGIPHFYINDNDCETMFNDFIIINIQNIRELSPFEMNFFEKWSPHYFVHLKKKI